MRLFWATTVWFPGTIFGCNQLVGIGEPVDRPDAMHSADAPHSSDGAPEADRDVSVPPDDVSVPPDDVSASPDDVDAGNACTPSAPRAARVTGVRALGSQTQPPTVTQRNLTTSARLGQDVLWAFGGIFLGVVPPDGNTFQSSNAAKSTLLDPVHLSESLDDMSLPTPLIPLTQEEIDFNKRDGGDSKVVLLPSSVVPMGNGDTAIIFFGKYIARGDLNWTGVSTGIARLPAGATTAARDASSLFSDPEPLYSHAAVSFEGDLYLYACNTGGFCSVARAPVARVSEHDAWRAFSDSESGPTWSADFGAATGVLDNVGGTVSVSYNAHLGSFVAVYGEPLGPRILLRTAPRPEGPWSAPVLVYDAASSGIFGAIEHPAFSKKCGQTLLVSYSHLVRDFVGTVELVEVTLD